MVRVVTGCASRGARLDAAVVPVLERGAQFSPFSLIVGSVARIFCLMIEGVAIENLPETKDTDGAKRWEEEKGEFVQIAYDEEIRHLAYFEIRRGFWRGRHYHEKKEETFYVAGGVVRAAFVNPDTGEREEHVLRKGQRIRIKPRIWHVFYGLEDSTVVEYSPQKYDKNDAYRDSFEL